MVHVTLWLTNKCNFRCTYCYENEENSLTMSYETANKFIDYIKTNYSDEKKVHITFHGGEPLLNFEVMKYIVSEFNKTSFDMEYALTTNLSIANKEMLSFISENFENEVSVSIDGMKKDHNINRKSKDNVDYYEKIMKNAIDLNNDMLKKGFAVRVRMTININNYYNLYNNVKYFYELGFKVVSPALDFKYTEWNNKKIDILLNEFKKIQIYEKNNGIIDGIYWISPKFQKIGFCEIGEKYFNVYVNGEFYPCILVCNEDDFSIGSLHTGMNYGQINSINDINKKNIKACAQCDLYSACTSTRCKLVNYSINKDMFSPCTTNCILMNIKYKLNYNTER